jgi:TonB-linked SusC/RagA family outer membrane protein
MRRILSLFTMLMLCSVLAFSQSRVVTGKLIDNEGNPVQFGSVVVKGTPTGTSTDANGLFSIKVKPTDVLSFSSQGFNGMDVTVGSQTVLNITMQRNAELKEVVVTTALNIQRQRKQLGYATAKVSNKEINQASPVNVANALQGKVSGVNISSVNAGVFEDTKINFRGIRSLTGNNNPLLVVDGIPTPISFLSSINAKDIVDVNIIKGAGGAAIYGSEARNGAIIITTKRGADKPVVSVGFTSQYSSISLFPKLQNEFGNGFQVGNAPSYVEYENWSWGPRFDGSMVNLGSQLNNGQQQMVVYSPNNSRKEFFNQGVTNQADVSLTGKEFYLGVQDVNIKGIVPNDKNRRTSFRFNADKTYGRFGLKVSTTYIQQNFNVFDDGAMSSYQTGVLGAGLNDGLMNLIFNTPAHVPLTSYKNYKTNTFAQFPNYFNHYGFNPYMALDTWRRNGRVDNVLTSLETNYKLSNSLNATWRLALNVSNQKDVRTTQEQVVDGIAPNTVRSIPGSYGEEISRSSRISSEFFLTWKKNVGNFKLDGILGTYVKQNDGSFYTVGVNNLVVPGLNTISNGVGGVTGSSSISKVRTASVFGQIGISYKGWANLEIKGRNDWSSVFSPENRSLFYPAASFSFVATDAIKGLRSNFLSFLKLRASYSNTANMEINPYRLLSTFSANGFGFPYTVPGFSADGTALNPALRPELITSKEAGFEVGFFKNRVNIELAVYDEDNTDQIISADVSRATGYTRSLINAASFKNRGFDFDLRLTPLVKLGDFRANVNFNASYNDSKVTALFPGVDRLSVGGFADASNFAIVNAPAFVFLATDYLRDSLGRVIVSKTTGAPTVDPNLRQFGRTQPLWTLGISPSISYKNVTLTVLAEHKTGHQSFSKIGDDMAWTGVGAATAQNGRERWVMPNSVYLDNGVYVPNNNVPIQNVEQFFTFGAYRDAYSNFLHSAASWRIREVALAYELPSSIFANSKSIKSLTFTVNARNLFLWVPKSNIFTDPDFSFGGGSGASQGGLPTVNNVSGVSTSQINPPTRTVGFTINATF